jgi:hypothetical protein
MSGTVNNGKRGIVVVEGQSFLAGIVRHEKHIEISYAAPTTPRPVVGGSVTLHGVTHLVTSVETSRYVEGYIVVKVDNA